MLSGSADSTWCPKYLQKRRIWWRRGAARVVVQTFGLAGLHRLQLRTLNLVLLEQIVGLSLDFPSYPPRTELRLDCHVINIGMANQQSEVTYLHSVANVEVQGDALARCQSCQGTYSPAQYHVIS
jgi:hypothetical protein